MSPATCLHCAVLSRQQPRTDLVVTSIILVHHAVALVTAVCLWLSSRCLSLLCACHVLSPLFPCSWLKRAYNRTFHAVALSRCLTCPENAMLCRPSLLTSGLGGRVRHVHALCCAGVMPHLFFACHVLPPLTCHSWLRRAYNRVYHAVVPVTTSLTGAQLMLEVRAEVAGVGSTSGTASCRCAASMSNKGDRGRQGQQGLKGSVAVAAAWRRQWWVGCGGASPLWHGRCGWRMLCLEAAVRIEAHRCKQSALQPCNSPPFPLPTPYIGRAFCGSAAAHQPDSYLSPLPTLT